MQTEYKHLALMTVKMSVNKISSFKHLIKNQQVKPQKDN
ncbi:Hypothetical protein AJF4211_001700 [Avibacterium paragallinarum JF4211]|nr:Hypothetical protein AJF4211_001700 [Avibacterium paragallinarum JF4211]